MTRTCWLWLEFASNGAHNSEYVEGAASPGQKKPLNWPHQSCPSQVAWRLWRKVFYLTNQDLARTNGKVWTPWDHGSDNPSTSRRHTLWTQQIFACLSIQRVGYIRCIHQRSHTIHTFSTTLVIVFSRPTLSLPTKITVRTPDDVFEIGFVILY